MAAIDEIYTELENDIEGALGLSTVYFGPPRTEYTAPYAVVQMYIDNDDYHAMSGLHQFDVVAVVTVVQPITSGILPDNLKSTQSATLINTVMSEARYGRVANRTFIEEISLEEEDDEQIATYEWTVQFRFQVISDV